jgi:hypothetical protein
LRPDSVTFPAAAPLWWCPSHIGFTAKDAAGLGGVRHKRFQHRQIEAVEVYLRAPFRAGINGLRHAEFGIRVGPAVRPDTDFLFGLR